MRQRSSLGLVAFLAAAVVCVSGCGFDGPPANTQQAAQVVAEQQAQIVEYDRHLAELRTLIDTTPGVPPELAAKAAEAIDNIRQQRANAEAVLAQALDALSQQPSSRGEQVGQWLQAAGRSAQTVGGTLPAPVGAGVSIGGYLLTLVGVFLARRYRKALRQVVTGIESAAPALRDSMKSHFTGRQSRATEAIVQQIRAQFHEATK